MKQLITILSLLTVLTISCNRIKTKTKETINKSGEAVGKSTAEFFEGVSEGVDRTLQCEILLSKDLQEKGITTGKFLIENDTTGGVNNILILYLIFDKDYKAPIVVKAFDKSGLEIGRTTIEIERKAGEAGYYDFVFDKRTYIEVRSKMIIE